MEAVDAQTAARASTLGTGGGTDHDDASIRARPVYRWEGLLAAPDAWARLAVWLGLTPLWRAGGAAAGLALDVRLDHGRYVPVRHGEDEDDRMYS